MAETADVVAPPPALYLGTLALSFLCHWLWPLRLMDGLLHWGLALLLLAAGAGLAAWSFATMRRAHTSPNPYTASAALVTAGPFGWSRNPIYVAQTLLYAGLALAGNSAWPFLWLVPLLAVMNWGVIGREERYLRDLFGAEYEAYCRRVRRWV